MAGNRDIPRVRNPPSGDGHIVTDRLMTATELSAMGDKTLTTPCLHGRKPLNAAVKLLQRKTRRFVQVAFSPSHFSRGIRSVSIQ